MARLPRAVLPGGLHLILHRGRGDQPLFVGPGDAERYLAALREAAAEAQVQIHAYGLTDQEVRLLVTPANTRGLADMMQATGRRYVRGFNLLHGRKGTPWEGRFRSTIVDPAAHFVACLRFVEGHGTGVGGGAGPGPVPALAASSAAHHLGHRVSPLITEHPRFWALGNTPFEREAAYGRLLERSMSEKEVAEILHAVSKGWVHGPTAFVAAVDALTGRRGSQLVAGRPKKRTD